jgi:hypothetical protein
LLAVLWQRFEKELIERFPDCERIVTPAWEPKYKGEQRWRFLADQGYTPHVENIFAKCSTRSGEVPR